MGWKNLNKYKPGEASFTTILFTGRQTSANRTFMLLNLI
ncbi:hypothetical protein A2U01_0118730, partial [Trifolium medium]|nr:hypothetical protein [Trifolium medium]